MKRKIIIRPEAAREVQEAFDVGYRLAAITLCVLRQIDV